MSNSDTLQAPAPRRARRSHAERRAETRARIKDAVVESISEVGYPKTTANEITRRAGVTWGAVQHHFGGKDGILGAVLEDSFAHFAEGVEDLHGSSLSVEERVSLFVDRAWDHFGSARYRSTFEILLGHVPEDPKTQPAWQLEMFEAWNGVWSRVFGDLGLSKARTRVIQHYTISVLSGLASMQILAGSGTRIRRSELGILKASLARELTASI
jgi:AcrR family transcriptional regulator